MNMLLLEAAGTAADPTATPGTSTTSMIIMIVLVIAVFYFMIIRPENKKKKQANEMRNSLKVGDEITTIGGIMGTICAVKEETFVIETGADRVRVEFAKWALSTNNTAAAASKAAAAEKKEKKSLFGRKKKEED